MTVWVGKETFQESELEEESWGTFGCGIKPPVFPRQDRKEDANGVPSVDPNLPPPPPNNETSPQSPTSPTTRANDPNYWDQFQEETAEEYGHRTCHYKRIYKRTHAPSQNEFVPLMLDEPIVLEPGQGVPVYIHSTLPGDTAIVYAEVQSWLPKYRGKSERERKLVPTYNDPFLKILPGYAHVSNDCFGRQSIWGHGNPWRRGREYVGSIGFGVCYKLWDPKRDWHWSFGPKFRSSVLTMLAIARTNRVLLSTLPDEVIFYILNMCPWDWFGDTAELMMEQKGEQQQEETSDEDLREGSEELGSRFDLNMIRHYLSDLGLNVPNNTHDLLHLLAQVNLFHQQYSEYDDDDDDDDDNDDNDNDDEDYILEDEDDDNNNGSENDNGMAAQMEADSTGNDE